MADGEVTPTPAKKSDLGVRTASAIVMLAVAGLAVWLGGWFWIVFVAVIALGVLREWGVLAFAITPGIPARVAWLVAGVVYIGIAAITLISLRVIADQFGSKAFAMVVGGVIATDIGAYFAGRTIGGPKIAPRISPSKTWAGLAGGMFAASLLAVALMYHSEGLANLPGKIIIGCGTAIAAQTGDFFESWMKRRAGVKDSGHLIPGHGGLFDRVDGLLAVLFVLAIIASVMVIIWQSGSTPSWSRPL
ncbi:phosphatidate cytidylyltransferase [Alteraurantiacibacter aestuarii]|uniref:phosphatidate cytidylyltransferase n=1 Tax=Alteraurantiacibacter aestuarii TaxID=650004 RepID=UPI0031E096D5